MLCQFEVQLGDVGKAIAAMGCHKSFGSLKHMRRTPQGQLAASSERGLPEPFYKTRAREDRGSGHGYILLRSGALLELDRHRTRPQSPL